ncbi:MAG: hypothetical protein U0234_25885 [Sandaracinus sp.]
MNNDPYGNGYGNNPPPPAGPPGYGGPLAPLPPSGFGPGGAPPFDETLSWVAIACSSVSWASCCCSWVPFVGWFISIGGTFLALVGVIIGYMQWQKAKAIQGARSDLPMIGLVIGAVRLGLTIGAIGLVVVLMVMGVGVGILEGITHPH